MHSLSKRHFGSKITELGDVEGKAMLSYDEEYAKQLDIEIKLKMYEQIKLPPGLPAAEETTGGVKAMPLKITKPDNIFFFRDKLGTSQPSKGIFWRS